MTGGRFGWAVVALALGGFGIGTGEFVIMGLLPQVAESFGISIPTAGHVSDYALGGVVGAPLIAIAQRGGRGREISLSSESSDGSMRRIHESVFIAAMLNRSLM